MTTDMLSLVEKTPLEKKELLVSSTSSKTKGEEDFDLLKRVFKWGVRKSEIWYPEPNIQKLTESNKFQGVVRQDTGELLGVVQEGYECVQNDTILEMIKPSILDGDLEVKDWYVKNYGATNFIKVESKNEKFVEGDPSPLKYGLTCKWGHGGSNGISFLPYLGRLLCNNGMSTDGIFEPFYFKHSSNVHNNMYSITKSIYDKLVAMDKNVDIALETFKKYSDKNLDEKTCQDVFVKLYAQNLNMKVEDMKKKMTPRQNTVFTKAHIHFVDTLEKYIRDFDKVNGWVLYNALTDVISNPENEDREKTKLKRLTRNNTMERKINSANKIVKELCAA